MKDVCYSLGYCQGDEPSRRKRGKSRHCSLAFASAGLALLVTQISLKGSTHVGIDGAWHIEDEEYISYMTHVYVCKIKNKGEVKQHHFK